MYFVTPHQPNKFKAIPGIRSVQYSHQNDAISSNDPWWLPNGGSDYSKIKGISEFDGRDIMGGKGQPPAEGPSGNRGGHNVTDNDFIFSIPDGKNGSVQSRKDKNVSPSNTGQGIYGK